MPYHPEIFQPYERLISISVCGESKLVPEKNSILRCLQFLDMERISDADLCWNGECINCQVWIRMGEKEKAVMACRTNVAEGMVITRISDPLK